QPPTSALVKHDFREGGWEWYPGAWMEARARLGRLLVIPGWRVDSFSGSRVTFDPRLNVVVELQRGRDPRAPARTLLKAGIGLFHQPAGAPYADAALGNPRLRPQQAIQAS